VCVCVCVGFSHFQHSAAYFLLKCTGLLASLYTIPS